MSQTFLAIDGMAYIFRAYHAVPYMCSRAGVPTNALYGFQKIYNALVSSLEPDYLAVAFDTHEPTFRHKAYPQYKAQRPPAPEELLEQIPLVKEFLKALNVKVVETPGYEADDALATMALDAKKHGLKAVIATSDKDLCQLVDDDIFILRAAMNTRDFEMLDRGGVFRHYGVYPEQIIDYLTIVGDAADNVKGVAGLGEKSAREILATQRTLQGALDNLSSLKPAWQKKLLEAKDEIAMTRFLIKICTEVPLDFTLEETAMKDPNAELLGDFCRRLDITTFGARLNTAPKKESPKPTIQQELF